MISSREHGDRGMAFYWSIAWLTAERGSVWIPTGMRTVLRSFCSIHPWLFRKENLNYVDLLVFEPGPGLPVALPAAL